MSEKIQAIELEAGQKKIEKNEKNNTYLGLVQQIRRKHGDGVMGLDEPRRGQTFNVLKVVFEYLQS